MGSNQNLKAYVRYDGSNRVVAGSLIFRRKKPTVGKWHEIAISECCEYIPTSTTTTTSSTSTSTSTSTTTTTTTTAAVIEYRLGIFNDVVSCNTGIDPSFSVYSSQSNPLLITVFYGEPELINPVSGIGNYVGYAKASDLGVLYSAQISEVGVVTNNVAC